MPGILCVRIDWDRTAIPLRIASRFYTLHVAPEPAYPFGRKGLAIARTWQQLAAPDCAGMLVLDGDVVIDPRDWDLMLAAAGKRPGIVHTAPVRLWPVSTHKDGWVWGHGRGQYSSDDVRDGIDTFTFCFTYLPRALIERCIEAGLDEWQYPAVDRSVVREARAAGLTVNVVRDCQPKHINY